MKILSGFDTKLDEKKLLNSIKEYGKAFLIKRHSFYLLGLIKWFTLSTFVFILLIYVLGQLLPTYLFLIMAFLNLIGMGMWLILTMYQLVKYLKNYNFLKSSVTEENLQDGILEHYIKYSLFLFFYQIVITILITVLAITQSKHNDILSYLYNFAQIILSSLFLYFTYRAIHTLINFEMDFVIVNSKELTYVNQTGFLKRESKTIGIDKIKSIQAKKKGLIRTIFNFGEIHILTEGDEQGDGELILFYIPEPENTKDKILRIINSSNNNERIEKQENKE